MGLPHLWTGVQAMYITFYTRLAKKEEHCRHAGGAHVHMREKTRSRVARWPSAHPCSDVQYQYCGDRDLALPAPTAGAEAAGRCGYASGTRGAPPLRKWHK